MDNVTLKKKLSSYLSASGRLSNVSEEVLFELLTSWEQWTGPSKDFYRTLGFTHKQMAKLLGKAKKLKREGHFGESDFKAVKIESNMSTEMPPGGCGAAEIVWNGGKVIRFSHVEHLVDFLKKAA